MVAVHPRTEARQETARTLTKELRSRPTNIGETERLLSILVGIPVTISGLTRGMLKGWAPTLLGSNLVLRGVTGYSILYHSLGVSTVHHSETIASLPYNQGIAVKRAITIEAPPEDLYRFWHDVENAPRYMIAIESVQAEDERHSHWAAKTPLGELAWDVEIVNDVPGHLIVWRKTQGSFLAPSGGRLQFERRRNGQETIVSHEVVYHQFKGPIGALLGYPFGRGLERVIRLDLERCKELIETGEIATTAGQPSGRRLLDAYKEA